MSHFDAIVWRLGDKLASIFLRGENDLFLEKKYLVTNIMTEEKDLFQLRKRSFSQNDLNKDFWKKYHLPQIVAKNGPSFAEVVT